MKAGERDRSGLLPHTDHELENIEANRLIARIQAGDGSAFDAIYSRYFDRVYTYLRLLFRDAHEAEDAAQAIFLKLYESLPAYKDFDRPFHAWLFVVARNHALNQLRKLGRSEVEDPGELTQRRDRSGATNGLNALGWISDADLLLFIERLPLIQRQVVTLRFLLDLSPAQTAQILDRKPAEVRKLQFLALEFLRERLISLGHAPALKEQPAPAHHRPRQARVLRNRRFALD